MAYWTELPDVCVPTKKDCFSRVIFIFWFIELPVIVSVRRLFVWVCSAPFNSVVTHRSDDFYQKESV